MAYPEITYFECVGDREAQTPCQINLLAGGSFLVAPGRVTSVSSQHTASSFPLLKVEPSHS